jgi:CIC family chloride channel protein
LIAVLIGAFAGLVVVCFHVTIDLVSWLVPAAPSRIRRLSTLLSPAVGAAIAVLLVRRVFRSANGSAVNNTRAAIYISDGYVPFGSVVGKFGACAVSIGSGNPLGPEDPALQMGAGIASLLGRVFHLDRDQMRHIAPVGAAAGIAAAFNTPITGVLFVIEEVLVGWNAGVLGSIVLSAVSAVVVTRAYLGDEPLFRVPTFALTHPSELVVYAAIGLAGGLIGAMYSRGMTSLRARLLARPAAVQWVAPVVAGLGVGAVALVLPQVLGSGYGAIDSALHDEFPWPMLLTLGLVRAVLTTVVFASGTPGGLFAPTLFVGAMIGGGLGGFAHQYWPMPTSPASAYVLVGMGTLFAAVFRAPMTSIFMIFEVSATYVIILPVMVANTIAWLVARSLAPRGIFAELAELENLVLPTTDEERERRPRRVEEIMESAARVVEVDSCEPLLAARQRARDANVPYCLVQFAGRGWGLVPQPPGADDDGARPVGEVAGAHFLPVAHPDEPIESALRSLGAHPVVPVASRTRPPRLLGVLTLQGVLEAYGLAPPPVVAPPSPGPDVAVPRERAERGPGDGADHVAGS